MSNRNSDATPFAVVSGEITLNSLRLFLDEALPQCSKKDNYECVLFDDRGNLVYRNDLEFIKNTTSFLGRDIDILRALLFQSGASWSEKRQCQDLFNVNIDTNRFYTVSYGAVAGLGFLFLFVVVVVVVASFHCYFLMNCLLQ